jgi:hypothetical protein
MNRCTLFYATAALTALSLSLLSGCGGGSDKNAGSPKEKPGSDAAVKAARAKLSAEDQEWVEAQDLCPVSGKRLGSMGTPVQVTIKDQPVFLCCESCRDKALADPDKTLAKVEELTVQTSRAKLSPEDRRLVDAQDFCAVMEDSRLGAMGEPLKVMIKGKPVFLCCKGCEKKALANPDKTLAKVEELKAKHKTAAPEK